MTEITTYLFVIYSIICLIRGNDKSFSVTGLSTSKNHDPMIEVVCTIFTVLDSCSNYIDLCGETCERFREECKRASVGSRYYSEVCNNETIPAIFSFLSHGDSVHENVTWENLKENPLQIVNYVMSNMFGKRQFHKLTSKMRHIISSIHFDERTFREGPNHHNRNFVKLAERIDLLCVLFTVTKSCSSQLDCQNSINCRRISLLCCGLSAYSRYLTSLCHVDVIYDIMELTANVEKREHMRDVELFWREMFKSPALFMYRVANAMFDTVFTYNAGHVVPLNYLVFLLPVLFMFLSLLNHVC